MGSLIEMMEKDLMIQHYSPRTITAYRMHIKAFVNYHSKPVEHLAEDDIRNYLYHVKVNKNYSHSNLAQTMIDKTGGHGIPPFPLIDVLMEKLSCPPLTSKI